MLSCERGATVLEFAFLAPVFFAMVFGIINIAQVGWTLGSLYYAAESAARYASISTANNDGTSPTASTVETYAANVYYGENLGSTNPFNYSATGCGNTVTASYTYSLTIPLAGTWSIPLSVAACFP